METKVIKGTKDNFGTEIASGLAFVDFWAIWCGPCKMLAPIIEEIANEIGDKIKIAKVNVDEEEELSARFNIMNIPTMVVLKDGVEIERLMGFRPKAQILEVINKHLGALA